MVAVSHITVHGARQHNLKNVSCELPRNALVVITGPSGSGKTSLAFDTIFAEGQRRYVDSLPTFARQFLDQLPKPDVDSIEGLSPSIAIEQRPTSRNPRSTVGSVTEISEFMRLLFARVGVPHCPKCDTPISSYTIQEMVDTALALPEGSKLTVLAPIWRKSSEDLPTLLTRLRRDGFVRVRIDGHFYDLGEEIHLRGAVHDVDVVIDRVVVKPTLRARLADSFELALSLGQQSVLLEPHDAPSMTLSERLSCLGCGLFFPALEPALLSYNNPAGACSACGGLGQSTSFDPNKLVPNPKLSLREGAVACWGARGSVSQAVEVAKAVKLLKVSPDAPLSTWSSETLHSLLCGEASSTKKLRYEGVIAHLMQRFELETDDDPSADEGALSIEELELFKTSHTCSVCHGSRLGEVGRAVRLAGSSLADLGRLPLHSLSTWIDALAVQANWSERQRTIGEPLVRAIGSRLRFLLNVGVEYLTLDRAANSLSGGESQRIRLATQLGASLTGVLYVLDEPSVGLHPIDNNRLLQSLRHLVELGNTVLVVEHDRDTIRAADFVVDLGPGAGELGGKVVAQGAPDALEKNPASVTGPFLAKPKPLMDGARKAPSSLELRVEGATLHNLKDLTVAFPVGCITAVAGVSGSGKSTLVLETILPALRASLAGAEHPTSLCRRVCGASHFDRVAAIDQSPLGRSSRSNPASAMGILPMLRELMAGLPEARARGFKPGRFSFNVKGGRCEVCKGEGAVRVSMSFLPDLLVPCEACRGARFNRETLEITYRGHSIAGLLNLTVHQAATLFEAVPKIAERLTALLDVGLGYLRLGQSASTLSGGEAQRVKLARELFRRNSGRCLFVLDEPTTGLHLVDIALLLKALVALRDEGHTVIVIEHHLDVIACADWVVELGPKGGEEGGRLLFAGPPEAISACPASITGPFLKALTCHW